MHCTQREREILRAPHTPRTPDRRMLTLHGVGSPIGASECAQRSLKTAASSERNAAYVAFVCITHARTKPPHRATENEETNKTNERTHCVCLPVCMMCPCVPLFLARHACDCARERTCLHVVFESNTRRKKCVSLVVGERRRTQADTLGSFMSVDHAMCPHNAEMVLWSERRLPLVSYRHAVMLFCLDAIGQPLWVGFVELKRCCDIMWVKETNRKGANPADRSRDMR